MKKLAVLAAGTFVILSACKNKPAVSRDAEFDKYKEHFIDELWKTYPGWASSVGKHTYDSVLTVPDAASRMKELQFSARHLDSLKHYKLSELNDNNKTDYQMMENQLRSIDWNINTLKSYEWSPSDYNACGSFAELLASTHDSLDNRLHNIAIRIKAVPAYYEAAKANIKNPTLEHTALAIDQNNGGLSVFEAELPAAGT